MPSRAITATLPTFQGNGIQKGRSNATTKATVEVPHAHHCRGEVHQEQETTLCNFFPKSVRDNPRAAISTETGANTTRLILRTRANVEPWLYRIFASTFFPIADLLLVRKMLQGIKGRAEGVR